jgi:large subunit ribosomal protein L21
MPKPPAGTGALDEPPTISQVRDSMYAVIQTGGKQYRVEPGKTIQVEKLPGEAGAKIVFDQVLLVSSGDGGKVTVGKPLVAGAKVTGEIVAQKRGKKLIVFKFEYARNHVRKNGHRQDLTHVKIAKVEG